LSLLSVGLLASAGRLGSVGCVTVGTPHAPSPAASISDARVPPPGRVAVALRCLDGHLRTFVVREAVTILANFRL
jgi:hypothetical protein